jgi:hypothetical protein
MQNGSRKTLTLIQCNATLEVLHAHLVRAKHSDDDRDWILVYPEWVSSLLVLPDLWTSVIAGVDTRPEYGNAAKRLRRHLSALRSHVVFNSYQEIELVVSDLSWLMNNILVAWVSRLCSKRHIDFRLSLLDEGAVLYSGTRLGLRRTAKSVAKYAFLRLNRFPALLVHPKNADYLHRLCTHIYCLHPDLLDVPSRVTKERIHSEMLNEIYGDRIPTLVLPLRSCLYLSQPLYKLVGTERQLAVVHALREALCAQGIFQLFYKPHHADLPEWCELLEKECGFEPISMREMVPIEMLAARCDADIIVSHICSALLNLKSYGYRGRVIAYGLDQLSSAFSERSQLEDYTRALRRIGDVETLTTSAFHATSHLGGNKVATS